MNRELKNKARALIKEMFDSNMTVDDVIDELNVIVIEEDQKRFFKEKSLKDRISELQHQKLHQEFQKNSNYNKDDLEL